MENACKIVLKMNKVYKTTIKKEKIPKIAKNCTWNI
jgi:hypothetical protein